MTGVRMLEKGQWGTFNVLHSLDASTMNMATTCCEAQVCVVLQLWTAQPPLAEWIRRDQPAHTPPQRPPGAERKGRHKGRKQFSKPDCTGEGRRNRTHDRPSVLESLEERGTSTCFTRPHGGIVEHA
eukprot:355571-Chlamydomonas_euryale.AAC.4